MKTIIIIPFIMFAGFLLYSQNDIDGFRFYKWDTPFSQMSEGMTKSNSASPGFEGYVKANDNMMFEDIKAHTIIYMFKKGLFKGVSVAIYNKDVDLAVKILSAKYGEPKYTETPFLKNWEWHLTSSIIALSYFHTNKSEESAAIGIRKR